MATAPQGGRAAQLALEQSAMEHDTHIVAPDAAGMARAVALLAAGEVVALPTETVYGLAAVARDGAAVARIFAAKGRPADQYKRGQHDRQDHVTLIIQGLFPLNYGTGS